MKIFKTLLLVLCLLAQTHISNAKDEKETIRNCSSTKEYITALEFLRSEKTLAVPEDQAKTIAEKISSGCSNSAQRFIHITSLLGKAGLSGKNSVEIALQFVKDHDSSKTNTFVKVFKLAFLDNYLDLDLAASVNIAKSLSSEFDGNSKKALDDFEKTVHFCLSTDGLDLPKPSCADLAARIATLGDKYDDSVYPSFKKAFDYLRSNKGPGLATIDALRIAEELSAISPHAFKNFEQAYRYATSKNGLSLGSDEAIGFAKKLSIKSNLEVQ